MAFKFMKLTRKEVHVLNVGCEGAAGVQQGAWFLAAVPTRGEVARRTFNGVRYSQHAARTES